MIEFDSSDPVESALWKAIQTPAFQRLRRIKQLGLSHLVYPGAAHSRFSHSIGVFHIARNLVRDLEKRLRITNTGFVRVAALLHDVGHGPFSHAFERVYSRLGLSIGHERITSDIIASEEMREALRSIDDQRIVGAAVDYFSSDCRATSLGDLLVASQLDADRLDYILRDQAMTGTKVGTIDYGWIVDNLRRIDPTSGAPVIAITSKAVPAIELYVTNLFLLYSTVYLHKTTRSAEAILREIIFEVFSRLRAKESVKTIGIYDDHPLARFAKAVTTAGSGGLQGKSYLPHFLKLDDETVMGAIRLLGDRSKVDRIRRLARCLLDRVLPKSVDVRASAEECLRQACPSLFPATENDPLVTGADVYQGMLRARVENEVVAASLSVEEHLGACGNGYLLQDRVTRKAYDREKEPIYVVADDQKLSDLWDVSPVVRALGEYSVHRLYFMVGDGGGSDTREELEATWKKAVRETIIENNEERWSRLENLVNSKSEEWLKAASNVAGVIEVGANDD